MSNLPEIWVVVDKDDDRLHTGRSWRYNARVRAGTTKAQANRIAGQVGGRVVRYVPAEEAE